jgi:glycine/D-amino acid oxidase-like deaminating enzyme
MATKSLALWEEFTADIGEQTGFSRCGLLYVSNDEAPLNSASTATVASVAHNGSYCNPQSESGRSERRPT